MSRRIVVSSYSHLTLAGTAPFLGAAAPRLRQLAAMQDLIAAVSEVLATLPRNHEKLDPPPAKAKEKLQRFPFPSVFHPGKVPRVAAIMPRFADRARQWREAVPRF